MPYIEQEKLQRLIQDVNILDVVNYLGIACHKKGSNYFLLCPSPEHNDTLNMCDFLKNFIFFTILILKQKEDCNAWYL